MLQHVSQTILEYRFNAFSHVYQIRKVQTRSILLSGTDAEYLRKHARIVHERHKANNRNKSKGVEKVNKVQLQCVKVGLQKKKVIQSRLQNISAKI